MANILSWLRGKFTPRGKWLKLDNHVCWYKCTRCGYIPWLDTDVFDHVDGLPNYCPYCGANMWPQGEK